MANTERNNNLYFIVGGLVVLAVIFGFIFWNADRNNELGELEPAAGTSTQMDQTEVDLNDDGGTITHTDSTTQE